MLITYSEHHIEHNTRDLKIQGIPFNTEEVPDRAEIILSALKTAQLGQIFSPTDFGIQPILAVHSAEYIWFLQHIFAEQSAEYGAITAVLPETFAPRQARRKTQHVLGSPGYYAFGVGSPILEGTWSAAYWSAQCALTAAYQVRNGAPVAYALCRPPGHHAGVELYGGFCYLNNAAIAARSLNARTAILDIDYHHGNGTQEIFYKDPTVLYCSIHADPDQDYPFFWGAADECGEDAGRGFNLNIPLPLGSGDEEYFQALEVCLQKIWAFCPDYLILSAGLDIVEEDPSGGFFITPQGLQEIGTQIARLTSAGVGTIIVQEGGYLLERLGENALSLLAPFG